MKAASGHRFVYVSPLLSVFVSVFNVVSVHLSFDVCTHVCVFAIHLFLCIIVFYFVVFCHSFSYSVFSDRPGFSHLCIYISGSSKSAIDITLS